MHYGGEVQADAPAGAAAPARHRSLGRRLLNPLLQVAVMGGLCLLLLRFVDLGFLPQAYARADLRLLPLAVILLTASITARTVRLWVLTEYRIKFRPVFHAHNVGMAINNLLPLRAGEVLTALVLGRAGGIGAPAALSIIAVDRILDIMVLAIFYAIVVLLTPEMLGNMRYADGLLIVFVLAVFTAMWLVQSYQGVVRRLIAGALSVFPLASRARWQQRADGILDGFRVLGDRRTMLFALLWSPVGWLLSFAACHVVLKGFWPDAPVAASVLAVCLSALSVTIVTVPAGIGVMHASLFFSVTLFGMDHENALLFALVYHALIVALSFALGILGLRPSGLTVRGLGERFRRQKT